MKSTVLASMEDNLLASTMKSSAHRGDESPFEAQNLGRFDKGGPGLCSRLSPFTMLAFSDGGD